MASMRFPVGRLPIALLIMLLVSVGLGTGMASTGDERAASMTVAEPRIGDRGAYKITLTGPWQSGYQGISDSEPDWRTPWTYMRFSWQQEQVFDERGALLEAAVLQVVKTEWDFDLFSDTWDLVDGQEYRRFAGDEDLSYGASGVWGGAPSWIGEEPARIQLQEGLSIAYDWQQYGSFRDDCVAGRVFAGSQLVVGTSFPLSNSCLNMASSFRYGLSTDVAEEGRRVQVMGVQQVAGVAAMHVVIGEQHHWYVPGLPVPLRVEQIHEDGRLARLDLSGFARGDRPLPDPQRAAPMPPMRQASIQPWGPSMGAVEADFDGQAAWTRALADASLQRFMERPDAFVLASERSLRTTADYDVTEWAFTVTDGPSALQVEVTQERPVAARDWPAALREAVAEYTVSVEPWVRWSGTYVPSKSQLPRAAPTVEAVAQRWIDYGGQGELNSWGHRLTCLGNDRGCSDARYVVTAGERHTQAYTTENFAAGETGLDAIIDYLDASGLDVVGYTRMDFGGAGLVVPDAVAADSTAPPLDDTPAGASWLSAGVAAGIGAFSVLAGLLYAFWPTLKAAPLALFSRLQKPKLLEHPTRQMIVDAVAGQPGIHFNELRRVTGLANGTLRHHIDHLLRNDLLTKRSTEGYTCLFLKSIDRNSMEAAPVLRSKGAQAVLASIRKEPGVTGKAVAERLGLSPATVAYHVKRLQGAGAVRAERVGRRVFLTA